MQTNILDERPACNTDAPRWLVLHRPVDQPQRRAWGADMARLVEDLIRCDWVMWREGQEVHVKHRCLIQH